MATALLITRDDLVRFTAVNGNVDTDKFIQFIKIAQDIHIQNYLGTKLLQKIQADIIAGTLAGNYELLTETYVKPMLIHWAMVEYLPFAAYTIESISIHLRTLRT
jgi:sensor histidine kinase regulating citrate/malate metabolism